MTGIIIVGVGSPFGVDRLGWEVLERLKKNVLPDESGDERISYICSDRPGPALLEMIRGAGLAIIIDAIQAGDVPGKLIRLEGEQISTVPLRLSSHGFGIADTLALGKTVGGLPEKVVILGLEIGGAGRWQPDEEDLLRLIDAVKEETRLFIEGEYYEALASS